jgi:CRP/FNR family transcriptional regulator, cyclic AMP receptor protein
MKRPAARRPTIDLDALLKSFGAVGAVKKYRPTATIFSQGDPCASVMYLRSGRVLLTARSNAGRECVVARLGPGQFFGESCLAGRSTRATTATTSTTCTVRVIETATMNRLLQNERKLTNHFIAHVLARNIRIERDLLDHVFNRDSTEKRLARALMRLAKYGTARAPAPVRSGTKLSDDRLAELVGTTRARIDALMRKFQRLGFITRGDDTQVHPTLMNVVLDD